MSAPEELSSGRCRSMSPFNSVLQIDDEVEEPETSENPTAGFSDGRDILII